MAIKRKDGSIYKLSGPNPLLADQEIWSKESIFMYNMLNLGDKIVAEVEPEIKVEVKSEPKPEIKSEPKSEPKIESKSEIEIEPKPELKAEPKIDPPILEKPKLETQSKPEPTIEQKKRTESDEIMFCLPAVVEESEDPLYNDVVKRVTYKEPFRFLARPVQQNDVQFIIWTTDSRVTRESVVYHPDLRRWWKAIEVVKNEHGYFVRHTISDVTPSFVGV